MDRVLIQVWANEKLAKRIEKIIEKCNFRSRSHFLETAITKYCDQKEKENNNERD